MELAQLFRDETGRERKLPFFGKLKLGGSLNPSIQFVNGQGHLSFPSHNGNNVQKFSFSLADIEGGGTLECVQQTTGQPLQNIGHIQHKMRIHANDDVYETTRHRMAAAEETKKDKCTREIKPNQTDIGRKSSGVTLQQQQHKPGYQPTVHDPPYQQSQQKSENGTARGTNGRTQHGKPEIMKRNIRERLIHLLALRPYKKPELYAKLAQDGIRGQEKNCIAQALKAIASMRDNVYYLHRHMWNDVQEDWPFYSEQDRQTLKRRKPQNLTPPLSSDGGSSTSGQSPSSAHNGSSPPSGSKRPSIAGDEGGAAGAMPTAKKPRISHYKKDILPDINRSNVTPNAQESEDSGVSLSYSLVPNDVAKRIQHSAGDVMVADTLVISDRDNYDDQISAYREETKKVKSLKDDFSDQFTRITTVEQRRKYKTEFDNDFQEYRRLHEIVERVSRKFAQLEEDLQHQRNNERRYKEIQRQIIKEYDESIKDNRFQETKQRFNYLHSKLSHIKHLVHDYDVAITNGLCRPQENY
ncbi:hypothetical protein pipiens_012590 [Culex pipiens pipiens]|uniref:OCEL domain-containing protein n=1 Tax=Culex pipiens pipiens TaxID=38569 RepID=A0ABD1D1Q6_CULPP